MSSRILDQLMTPVADCLDAPSLLALVQLRASPAATERMQWLAEQANEGLLTEVALAEYQSSIQFASFLGTLQSKARRKLAAH